MIHTTLASLSMDELADAFNRVYAGYIMPARFTAEGIGAHMADYAIDRSHSPLWLADDGQVVGLAALGKREERGWIGGFGVAQEYRGQGISHALMAATLQEARGLGMRAIQLEVLTPNVAAIRTYERAGFVTTRELLVWECGAAVMAPPETVPTLQAIAPERLIPLLDTWRNMTPSWQREGASLRAPGLAGWALMRDGAPVAGLLARVGAAAARIADIGGRDGAALADLVAGIEQRLAGKRLALVNEPEGSPLNALLGARGWREVIRQYEMVVEIAGGSNRA